MTRPRGQADRRPHSRRPQLRGPHRRGTAESDDSGAALVEFALILPVFALILFAIVQFGITFAGYDSLRASAQTATRLIAIGGTGNYTGANECTAAKAEGSGLSNATIDAVCTVQAEIGSPVGVTSAPPTIELRLDTSTVTVCVQVHAQPFTGFFPQMTLSTTSDFPLENPTHGLASTPAACPTS